MSAFSLWLGRLGVHQDLLWFLVLLGWSLALMLWWRSPGRTTGWSWLPWAAAAGIGTALLQFLTFSPPFDLFYERLVPGTNDTYSPAVIDPDLFADGALKGPGGIATAIATIAGMIAAFGVVLLFAVLMGRAESRRLQAVGVGTGGGDGPGIVPAHPGGSAEAELDYEERNPDMVTGLDPRRDTLRPRLIWFNLALTVTLLVLLVFDVLPLPLLFRTAYQSKS